MNYKKITILLSVAIFLYFLKALAALSPFSQENLFKEILENQEAIQFIQAFSQYPSGTEKIFKRKLRFLDGTHPSYLKEALAQQTNLRFFQLGIERRNIGFSGKIEQISPFTYLFSDSKFIFESLENIGLYKDYHLTSTDMKSLKKISEACKKKDKKITLHFFQENMTDEQKKTLTTLEFYLDFSSVPSVRTVE